MGFDTAEYLAELSRFELLELYYLSRDALIGDVTIYMSVLFAYITLAHFAAAGLAKIYAVSVTVIYSFFALFLISSIYNSSATLVSIGSTITGTQNLWEPLLLSIFLFISWVFSIIMFVHSRRQEAG